METERKWDRKEEWRLRHRDFLVTVEHRADAPSDGLFGPHGGHRWAVYAYIYPKHPLFTAFAGASIFQEAALGLPFHGGCSLVRYHNDGTTITSVQVGGDYGHLHDQRFSYVDAFDGEVKDDAEALFDYLAQMAAPTATEASRD